MHLGLFKVLYQNSCMDLIKILDFLTPQGLKDMLIQLQERVNGLLNDNSRLHADNEGLKKKNQELEDRLRKLLGEKEKPRFQDPKNKDRTSDKTKRKKMGKRLARRKKSDLIVDKTVLVEAPTDQLDASFEYKGRRKVVIQEIAFQRENVCFELERFYSSAQGKVVEGQLPPEYQGHEFGPRLRTFIMHLYYHGDCTHNKIRRLLEGIGIRICNQTINNIVLERPADLEEELAHQRLRAIDKFAYQHIDDTGAKVLKEEGTFFTYVCSNPGFTWQYTINSKGKSAAVDALTKTNTRLYKLSDRVFGLLTPEGTMNTRLLLRSHIGERVYDENEVNLLVEKLGLSLFQGRKLKTAMHVGAMVDGHLGGVGDALVSDDAPNFRSLVDGHALCWVHELRHYKLLPILYDEHSEMLKDFLKEAWYTVELIEEYQKAPFEKLREKILKRVHNLFIVPSAWVLLDKQKALTAAKLDRLLYPLFNPAVPTDNNLAERDLRGRVIKRKVSLFNQTLAGAYAWDFWYSLRETCRKLEINFWKYLEDRMMLRFEVPALASMSMN